MAELLKPETVRLIGELGAFGVMLLLLIFEYGHRQPKRDASQLVTVTNLLERFRDERTQIMQHFTQERDKDRTHMREERDLSRHHMEKITDKLTGAVDNLSDKIEEIEARAVVSTALYIRDPNQNK